MDALARLERICLALPEAVRDDERLGLTYRVRDKIFAFPRQREGRPVVSMKAPPGSQEVLLGADPDRFFYPPYVGSKGWIGMWLDDGVDWDEVGRLARRSWTCVAQGARRGAGGCPMSELSAGDKAPEFDLPRDGGGRVKLSDYAGKAVVLYVYPKDDTTGCTKEAQGFTEAADDFARAGAVVIGLSKDSPRSHDRFVAKYGLKMILAADENTEVLQRYGAWQEKSMYGRKYMGADRSTFLIGPDGALKRVWRGVKVPGHVDQVLAAVKAL